MSRLAQSTKTNVQVLLENNGDKPFQVAIGNRIAQLVLYNIETPAVTQIAEVMVTTRGKMDSVARVLLKCRHRAPRYQLTQPILLVYAVAPHKKT